MGNLFNKFFKHNKNTYIDELIKLINKGKTVNTYKMAWIKSIVEVCERDCKKNVHFDELSPLIFKYYWDQTFFFNLNQGNNRKKVPKIIQYVQEEIENYKQREKTTKPIKFYRLENLDKKIISKVSTVLTQDVSEKFQTGNPDKIYKIIKKRNIKIKYPKLIKDNSVILHQLINYRWAHLLENYDGSPNIISKIKGVDGKGDPRPQRANLKKFDKYLIMTNPDKICFIEDVEIHEDNVSRHHVIPHSYIFSDNLWNLVFADKDANSRMSNNIPEENVIKKLEDRNIQLLNILEREERFKDDPEVEELRLAIDRDYLRLHFIGLKSWI